MKTIAKRLRSQSVVSDDLYIMRDADRQLLDVVEAMGRPAYVLVARQMGKTNLLLNMKRRVEEEGDIVIYIDLSQRFETARACFRYIIDLAIESRDELFSGLSERIQIERSEAGLDASLEYTRHLRLLLRAVEEKRVVIVLDEVDSLVNAAYSDSVLAHVRSTYFVRTNYKEFDRLTYVLSGVAEPSDLIKDKNISPFNIGEKIYLNNFSESELEEFVARACLNLDVETKNKVYFWSQGNPRISWDICAALEDEAQRGRVLTSALVDEVVGYLYLEAFDRPPIDHIRVLVEGDQSLRSSIVAVRFGKGNALDQKARSRLYLAGIIGDPGKDPALQNPIVDAALSDDWITQLEAVKSDPAVLASEHYIGGRYVQAREAFEKATASSTGLNPQQSVMYGVTLFHLDDYPAVEAVLEPVLDRVRGEVWTTAVYHLGSSYILMGRPEEAIVVLGGAAEKGSGPHKFPSEILRALANYQNSAIIDDGLRLSAKENILSAAKEESVGGELGDATVVPSHIYSVGYSAIAAGFTDDASDYLDCAASCAPPGLLPAIYTTKYALTTDGDERARLASAAARAILDNQLHPVEGSQEAGIYSERGLLSVLVALQETKQDSLAGSLAAFVIENENLDVSSVGYIARLFIRHFDVPIPDRGLIEDLVSSVNIYEPIKGPDNLLLQKALLIHAPVTGKARSIIDFLTAAVAESYVLSDFDITQIVLALQSPMTENDYSSVIRIGAQIDKLEVESEASAWVLLLWYYRMVANNQLGGGQESRRAAAKVIEVSKLVTKEITSDMEQFVATVSSAANRTLSARAPVAVAVPQPAKNEMFRGLKRNQKVFVRDGRTGSVSLIKFKLIEAKLKSGEYELVNSTDQGAMLLRK